MTDRRIGRVVLLALAATGLLAGRARAQVTTFNTGSLIIPMDACYARPNFMSGANVDYIVAPDTQALLGCNASSEKDEGIIKAYGFISLLTYNGIEVNWIIKPGKTSFHEVDFAITPGSLVGKVNTATGAVDPVKYAAVASVKYRGSAWVIRDVDASLVKTIMQDQAWYQEVDLHEALAPFSAPVYKTLNGMPNIAILDVDVASDFTSGETPRILDSIDNAGMTWGQDQWWHLISPAQLRSDYLITNQIGMLLVPSFNAFGGSNKAENITKFLEFLDRTTTPGPGSILFLDGAIAAMEGAPSIVDGWSPDTVGHAPTTLVLDGLASTYGNNNATDTLGSDDFSDPFAQWGGITWQGVGGAKSEWHPAEGVGLYNPGTVRSVYSTSATESGWELASWRYRNGDSAKGKIFYLGGDHLRYITMSPYRVLLNALFGEADTVVVPPTTSIEAARASPTIDEVGGAERMYQGTYDVESPSPGVAGTCASSSAVCYLGLLSANEFRFPLVKGHMRSLLAASIADGQDLDDAEEWDTNARLASLSSPVTQRRVMTHLVTGYSPTLVDFVPANANTLRTAISRPSPSPTWTVAEASFLIQRVLAGSRPASSGPFVARLGGVDRSAPVIVGRSGVVPGGNSRPAMIYFGATDGMLHAVCATAVGPCTQEGEELWAFLPKNQLSRLWNNTTRLDGAPSAIDAFDDFNGDGVREWHTLLVFQTASGVGTSSVYALDVTNPDPDVVSLLWERVLPGHGLSVSLAPVSLSTGVEYMAFILTNDGQRDALGKPVAPGIHLLVYDATHGNYLPSDTGPIWRFDATYPIAPRTIATADLELLGTGMPDGASALDLGDTGQVSHVIFPTLTGELFKIPADESGSLTTTNYSPFMRFTDAYHPIGASASVYRQIDNSFHAILVTGGYADPVQTGWSPPTTHQLAASIDLGYEGGTIEVADADVGGTPPGSDFVADLGAGNRAFSAATRLGDQLFVTTQGSGVDANSALYGTVAGSGTLRAYSLDGGSLGNLLNSWSNDGGASSASAIGGDSVFATGTKQIDKKAIAAVTGLPSAEISNNVKSPKVLWLKTH